MIAAKIKHGWGYDVGPMPPDVVLRSTGGVISIDYWPDDNPPTIAEIEAVELPDTSLSDAKTARQALLDANWAAHPGVQVTLLDGSTFYAPIQKEHLTPNRLEVLAATLEQRAAQVFGVNGLPVTIPHAELASVSSTVATGVQSALTEYYTAQAFIANAQTVEAVNAVDVSLGV